MLRLSVLYSGVTAISGPSVAVVLVCLGLADCSGNVPDRWAGTIFQGAVTQGANAGTAAPAPVLPFREAVASPTEMIFRSFRVEGDNGVAPLIFTIDPLIDGSTGAQSKATQYLQYQVTPLAETKSRRFRLSPLPRPNWTGSRSS